MKLEEIITTIAELRQWVKDKEAWRDPRALSETVDRLATLNAMLGDKLADLHYQASKTYLDGYAEARGNGETQGDAEVYGREQALIPRKEYEHANNVYQTTKGLISSRQTHINTLREEFANG